MGCHCLRRMTHLEVRKNLRVAQERSKNTESIALLGKPLPCLPGITVQWSLTQVSTSLLDWFDLLVIQGTLKSLLQHHNSKASILWLSLYKKAKNRKGMISM